jgi:hypothetical protein
MVNPDESAPASDVAPPPPTVPVGRTAFRPWAIALAAGLLAGLVAWGIGEATLVPEAGYENKKENVHLQPEVAGIRNATVSFGVLGAALGLGLGLAGGLIGRSVVRAIMAGVAGLVVGGGTGAGLALVLTPLYYRQAAASDITYALIVHAGAWVGAAAAAGLAFAIGVGKWRDLPRTVLAAASAAFIATVIFEFGGGILFPDALTDRPVSHTWVTRLVARLIVAVLVAAGVVLSAGSTGEAKLARAANT